MAAKDYMKHYTRDTRALLIADTTNDLQQREIGYATAEHMLVFRDTNDAYHNFMEADSVDSRSYASLAAAVAAIGLSSTTLVVTQAESVLDDLDVPDNIFLRATGSGSINVAAGKTMTIGPFDAPSNRKVFTGTGTIAWRSASNFRIMQQWTGGNTGVDSWSVYGKKTTNSTDSYFSWGYNDTDGTMKLSHGAVLGTNDLFSVTSAGVMKINGLTASQAVFTDASKNLVSNAITGSGNVVMSASPTLTGTIGAAAMTLSSTLGVTGVATFTAKPIMSSLTASLPVFSDASKGLVSNSMTGTGSVVMSASPTLTGTIGAASMTLSGSLSVGTTLGVTGIATFTAAPVMSALTASLPVFTNGSKGLVSNAMTGTGNVVMSASPTLTGTIGAAAMTLSSTLGVTGIATFTAQPIVSSLTASQAVFTDGSKGLVSNAITGTGNVVMSASPTLTGTIGAAAMTLSSTLAVNGSTTLSGFVGHGSAPQTNVGFNLQGLSGFIGASQYGLASQQVFNSSATTSGTAFYAQVATANSVFTTANIYGVYIDSPNKGASNTITTAYGLYVSSQTAGATNYAIKTGLGQVSFGDVLAVTGNILINGAANETNGRLIAQNGYVAATGTYGFYSFGTGVPAGGASQFLYMHHDGTNAILEASHSGSTYTPLVIKASGSAAVTVATTGAVTLASTLAVTSTSTLSGNVGIGGASDTFAGLSVKSTSLASTGQYMVSSNGTFNSSATNAGIAYYAKVNTAASAFTMTTARGMYIDNATAGSGSTISTLIGLEIASQTVGGTNYAIKTGTGQVSFGDVVNIGTVQSGAAFNVLGTIIGMTSVSAQYGVCAQPNFGTTATTAGTAMYAQLRTTGTFTMTSGYGLHVDSASNPSATITTAYGIKVEDQTAGGTNYSIYTGTGSVSLGDTLTFRSAGTNTAGSIFKDASRGLALRGVTGTSDDFSIRAADGTLIFQNPTGTTGVTLPTAVSMSSTLAVTGNLSINTSKFKVNGADGRTAWLTSVDSATAVYLSPNSFGLTGVSQNGILLDWLSDSGATTRGTALFARFNTPASVFTMATGIGVQIADAVKGSGSTITTQYGLKIENQTQGATNYAIVTGSGNVQIGALTASQAVFTDASKNLVSNAVTGTGNVVMSASPTLTGTISAAALTLSSTLTLNGSLAAGGTSGGYDYGTFTLTASTGFSGTVNGTASYVRTGKQVSIQIPYLSGTNNVNTRTLSGIPSSLRPASAQVVPLAWATNAGAATATKISAWIKTDGTVALYLGASLSGWDNNGFTDSIGLGSGIGNTITYTLD